MGLRCNGNRGAKQVLLTNMKCSFSKTQKLTDLLCAVGVERDNVALLIDGNVLLRAVPRDIKSSKQFLHYVFHQMLDALGTAELIVFVFDEPENLTEAKLEEQLRRDSKKKRVETEVAEFVGDEYDTAYISNLADVHILIDDRASRLRFFDHIILQISSMLQSHARFCNSKVEVILDGVDARGANRSSNEKRKPELISSNINLHDVFIRTVAIGEGDLKLMDISSKIHDSVSTGSCDLLKNKTLILHHTIDTDALVIQPIGTYQNFKNGSRVRDVVVFKERAKIVRNEKNKKRLVGMVDSNEFDEAAAAAAEEEAMSNEPSHFLVFDCMSFVKEFATPSKSMSIFQSLFLFACGAAASGCDFIRVPGISFLEVFEALHILKLSTDANDIQIIQLIPHDGVKQINCTNTLLDILPVVTRLFVHVALILDKKPRMKKQAQQVRSADDDCKLRVLWTALYWSEKNLPAYEFGFLPLSNLD